MPITSPCEFSSGPPELPGLMAASVWMASSIGAPSAPRIGADGADDAARHGARQSERVADGVNLLAHLNAGGVRQRDRLEVGGIDLQQRQVVGLVRADDARLVAVLVGELHLDAAVGAFDDVVVGQDVAGFVQNEPRALALLRHRAIEEVEHQRGGGDVDHRGHHALVDGDVVQLLGVECGSGVSLGQLQRAGAVPVDDAEMLQVAGQVSRDVGESAHQQKHQQNRTKFHKHLGLSQHRECGGKRG